MTWLKVPRLGAAGLLLRALVGFVLFGWERLRTLLRGAEDLGAVVAHVRLAQSQFLVRLPAATFALRTQYDLDRDFRERERVAERLRQVAHVRLVEQFRAVGEQHDRRWIDTDLSRVEH